MDVFEPKRIEKEVISMRIASDKLSEIDHEAAKIGISRNEFINQCIDFALSNMKNQTNK